MSIKLTATPEDFRKEFFELKTREDVAQLLDIETKSLNFYLHILRVDKRYTAFSIPKRSGGQRQISSPVNGLKIIQQKLNQVLQAVYQPKPASHGFSQARSIVTNANQHISKKRVLNIDLQDFFPSINFGRVRGLFIAAPYKLPEDIATILAQICCHENHLPQGAPTSPVISNMICSKLDSELQRLAKKHKCTYTRYVDDITFSTSLKFFPPALAKTISDLTEQIEVGDELHEVIRRNGFEINQKKLRLQTNRTRQEVTGLTVNTKVNIQRKYVRQVRAMLHAWEKYGLEAAQAEFISKHDKKYRLNPISSFAAVVKGKIDFLAMVKGKNDPNYLRFRAKLKELAPDLVNDIPVASSRSTVVPTVITEGKTDWKHLKAAQSKLVEMMLFSDLGISFHEYEMNAGDTEMLETCKRRAKLPNADPHIYIFDRDNPKILKTVMDDEKHYKNWGNNIFSFAIPIPDHRSSTPGISIEFYYKDEEIKRCDPSGRRLFLSSEFNKKSGKLLEDPTINCYDRSKCSIGLVVIDDQVYDNKSQNIALPKSHFAEYILNGETNFSDFDFSAFAEIFKVIELIIKDNF